MRTEELDRAVEAALLADVNVPGKSEAIDRMIRTHPDPQEGARNLLAADLNREIKDLPGPVLFPHMRRLLRDQMKIDASRSMMIGMGQEMPTDPAPSGQRYVYDPGQKKWITVPLATTPAASETGWLDVLNTGVGKFMDLLIIKESGSLTPPNLNFGDWGTSTGQTPSQQDSNADATRGEHNQSQGVKAGFLEDIPPWALLLGVAGVGGAIMLSGVLGGGSPRPRARRRRG